jgi:polyvinyl alcohol dehydrogenase (cytochrome)
MIRGRHVAVATAVLVLALSALAGCSTTHRTTLPIHNPGPWDWPTYGHDAQHTFAGRTTLTEKSVPRLQVAWFFKTGDAVTATPTVVDGTVYVGSWDDTFYALDLETGQVRWKFKLKAQNAVTPYPGQKPRPISSDGGLVTSSAWYQPGNGSRPDLVIFGGGYTLYALKASTGALYWRHDYSGRPERPPDPNNDGTRIFSSPVVVGDKVLFGTDVDGQKKERGYVVAADLNTGDPVWEYQTDVSASGHLLNNGCGSVWSSGSVLPALGLVVFDSADCGFSNPPPTAETVFALHISDGHLAWRYRPPRVDDKCDLDFGATANAGLGPGGRATFLGVGGKDGSYYSLDPATGHLRWTTNVVFGGFAGGFIATAAYDGNRVYGSTAIGDFGNFEGAGEVYCDPSDPLDLPKQEPSVHAFDAATGAIAWQASRGASFSPTTVAGGMTFNGPALGGAIVNVRDAASGDLIDQVGIPGANWSGIATVGDALILGIGDSYTAQPAGIVVVTPGGKRPIVP